MSIRPGQAKGPWVGIDGSGAGTGEVKVSSSDTTEGYLSEELIEGQAQELLIRSPSGDEKLEVIHGIAGFWDDFSTSKPFWDGNDAIISGDWQVDTVNEWLEGIAGSGGTKDTIRYGIEGDYDYAIKISPDASVSSGITITSGDDTTVVLRLVDLTQTTLDWEVTGKSTISISAPSSTYWMRQTRRAGTIAAYYKVNDTDPWTLLGSYTDVDPGYDAKLKLDAAIDTLIHEMALYDNMFPQRVRSNESKQFVPLTDGATINIDARQGNKFSVEIAGNRTIANPTHPLPEQMIIIAIKQDSTGSRTITWGSNFRFSGGTAPTLTTTGSKTDYLGFIYNSADTKWDNIAQAFNY